MRGISGAKSAYMGISEGKTEYIRGAGRAAQGRVRRTGRVLLAFGTIFLKIKSMIKSGEIELPKYDEIHIMAKKAKTEGVPAKHLISVKGLSQEKIPTGCEAVTTVTRIFRRRIFTKRTGKFTDLIRTECLRETRTARDLAAFPKLL